MELDEEERREYHRNGQLHFYPGQREGSSVYLCEGYWFHDEQQRLSTGEKTFKCVEYKQHGCHARAKSEVEGAIFHDPVYQDHNHPVNPLYGEYLLKRRDLIEYILETCDEGSITGKFTTFVRE